MKLKRRLPGFVTGIEETEHEVNNYEDLIKIDWVKNLLEMKNSLGLFYGQSDFGDEPDFLMSLSDGKKGVIYFVVGYLYGEGNKLGLTNYLDKI